MESVFSGETSAPSAPRAPITEAYNLEEFRRIDWEPVRQHIRHKVETKRLADRPRLAPRDELKRIPLTMAPSWPPPPTGELLHQEDRIAGRPMAKFPLKGVEKLTPAEMFARMKPIDQAADKRRREEEELERAARGLPKLIEKPEGMTVITNPIMRNEVQFLLREIRELDIMNTGLVEPFVPAPAKEVKSKGEEHNETKTSVRPNKPSRASSSFSKIRNSISFSSSRMAERTRISSSREDDQPTSSVSRTSSSSSHLPPDLQKRLSNRRTGGRFAPPPHTDEVPQDPRASTMSQTPTANTDTNRSELPAPSKKAMKKHRQKQNRKLSQQPQQENKTDQVPRGLANMSHRNSWVRGLQAISPAALRQDDGGYELLTDYKTADHGVYIPWEAERELGHSIEQKKITQLYRDTYNALEKLEEAVRKNPVLKRSPSAAGNRPTLPPPIPPRSHEEAIKEITVPALFARPPRPLPSIPVAGGIEGDRSKAVAASSADEAEDAPLSVMSRPHPLHRGSSTLTAREELSKHFAESISDSDSDRTEICLPPRSSPAAHPRVYSDPIPLDSAPHSPHPTLPRVPSYEEFRARAETSNPRDALYELFSEHDDAQDRQRKTKTRSAVEARGVYDDEETTAGLVGPTLNTSQKRTSEDEKRLRRLGWHGEAGIGTSNKGLRRSGAKRKSKGSEVE